MSLYPILVVLQNFFNFFIIIIFTMMICGLWYLLLQKDYDSVKAQMNGWQFLATKCL